MILEIRNVDDCPHVRTRRHVRQDLDGLTGAVENFTVWYCVRCHKEIRNGRATSRLVLPMLAENTATNNHGEATGG